MTHFWVTFTPLGQSLEKEKDKKKKGLTNSCNCFTFAFFTCVCICVCVSVCDCVCECNSLMRPKKKEKMSNTLKLELCTVVSHLMWLKSHEKPTVLSLQPHALFTDYVIFIRKILFLCIFSAKTILQDPDEIILLLKLYTEFIYECVHVCFSMQSHDGSMDPTIA